ncbi:MAG: tetratricopeptide repeat protein [Saprospiraceae bacterium]|nr:tetratricopeptide repeat protein [Saprospiraceae bacterium]
MSEIKDSKNVVTARIDADGNVIVGDGNNITVINLKEAAQYKSLEADIEKLNKRLERAQKRLLKDPDDLDAQEELLEIDAERNEKQNNLETLKNEVVKLAEDFQRIPLDTERLRLAKRHFDAGEFEKARAVFDAETMGKELDALLREKERLNQKTAETQQNLNDKANEYLILARLTATNFDLPDRFEKTMDYFGQSLRAERNIENLFAYAYFLQNHNQYSQAQPLYEEALQIYRQLAQQNPQTYLPDVAMTLNNLANLYSDRNEFSQAQPLYEEALQIYRQLAQQNPQTYLPDVAMTLNNLAILYKARNEFSQAQPLYEEALQIYRQLAQQNPQTYLPDVAMTLLVYGDYYRDTEQFETAIQTYKDALGIYAEFAQKEPSAYEPKVFELKGRLQIIYEIMGNTAEAEEILDIGSILNNPFLQNVMPPQVLPFLTLIENGGDETQIAEAFEELMRSLPEGKQQEIMKVLRQMGLFEEE